MGLLLWQWSLLFFSLAQLTCGLSADGVTLLDLSKTLILPSSVRSNWNHHDRTPCGWTGVGCDKMKNVIFLNLSHSGVSGSLGLQVGLLKHLKVIDLSYNNISGVLPASIGNCTELEIISLYDNHLSGSLPETLSNINGLQIFDIAINGFTGEINFSFENCKLQVFVLSYNQIVGKIPAWLGNCSSLEQLAFVNNSLSGQIPSSIGLLRNLSYLILSQNSLSGPIPPDIGNCQLLLWLMLDANQLEGIVPKALANLSNLQSLFLFENRLSGEFPKDIWSIRSLESVLIYENRFIGNLPPVLAELKFLQNITLFNNSFTGVIPSKLGVNSRLVHIDFTNNMFTGGIPPNICAGKRLSLLAMGFNLLNGSIPFGITECPSLNRVILKYNNLNGPVPQFGNCGNLDHIDLSYNSLSGHIPTSLGKCINITMINWSGNKLSGSIPPEIGKLVNLQTLNLSGNILQGPLPVEISGCSKLYQLDLSLNSLNGSALTIVSNLKFLSRLRLQENKFSGGLPESLSQLDMLIELQIGGNILSGSIPSSLGRLVKLSIALNLSRNGLMGDIPPLLGNLVELQSLDLSLNNLTGSLDPIRNLKFLNSLNVSYNMFSGPVPEIFLKFIQSTPSSFSGNPDLCVYCHEYDTCKGAKFLKPCGSLRKRRVHSPLNIAMIALGSLFVCAFLILCIFLRYRCSKTKKGELGLLFQQHPSIINEVIEVTENFDSKYIIGSGAHGTIYKAILRSGEVYAVKKLLYAMNKSSNSSMIQELKTLGQIRHRNIIRIKEFYLKHEYGLIIYDFMDKGSLHDVLHGAEPTPILDWSLRYNIAVGTAHGLAYLHNDCHPIIIHRDIKPKNILLNIDMVPHISDFGIAKLMDQSSAATQTTGIVGTIGYMAPEMAFSTRSTPESDVYSYGVVLLELITRKMAVDPSFPDNMDIVSWVSSILEQSNQIDVICDPSLMHEVHGTIEMEEVRKVVVLSLRCTAKEANQRPSMADVVKELTDARQATRLYLNQGKSGSSSS